MSTLSSSATRPPRTSRSNGAAIGLPASPKATYFRSFLRNAARQELHSSYLDKVQQLQLQYGQNADRTRQAEHPKWYIRRLWLVAEDDRVRFPKFLNKDLLELAGHVNKVVNTFVRDEDKRHEELCGDAFLEKDASRIMSDLGFGRGILGEGSGAEARLKSDCYSGHPPRWGIDTDPGYEVNDEDSIKLNLRCWMAARIQAQINTPSKEYKRGPSVTTEHIKQQLRKSASQLRQQLPESAQKKGSSDVSEAAPSCLEHRTNHSTATAETQPKAKRDRSRSLARSDDRFSFSSFIQTDSECIICSKCPKLDTRKCRSHTRSRQNTEVTSTLSSCRRSDTTTITLPDMGSNTDVDEDGLSGNNQLKQKLQFDLKGFLNNELDYASILPSAGVTRSLVNDFLQEIVAQKTFKVRAAMHRNLGPRSHTDFPLEELIVSLALFFDGLLGDRFMPVPFEDLVYRLRAANQSLYETIAVEKK
ncbi:hypothetical protein EK21DRAFT_95599 [Setomelanomma holmii]|uniref:Uncharacterized protein n=1 Tax=Setomelanomma holmii TaxID=210430 RepID=A0A9P4LEU1_9PLEO|nr:hypothetical protein EK21DRAFT_95599 [Setomelanomma holmii]